MHEKLCIIIIIMEICIAIFLILKKSLSATHPGVFLTWNI